MIFCIHLHELKKVPLDLTCRSAFGGLCKDSMDFLTESKEKDWAALLLVYIHAKLLVYRDAKYLFFF